MSVLNAELMKEIKERSTTNCIDLALQLMSALDGVGDYPLDRNQRILRFMDYAQSGTLDFLGVIGRQDLHDQLVRQFHDDMQMALGR